MSMKRIWLSGAIAIGLVFAFVILYLVSPVEYRAVTQTDVTRNPGTPVPSGNVPSRVNTPLVQTDKEQVHAVESFEPKLKAFRDSEYAKNKALNMRGRIIDQHGQPVAGVEIMVDLSYVPFAVVPGVGWFAKTTMVTSNQNGEFAVENQTGTTLSIVKIEKSGYRFGDDARLKVWSDSPEESAASEDSTTVVRAWKIEQPVTKVRTGTVAVTFKPNGEFVSVDFDKKYGEKDVTPGPPMGDLLVAILAGPRDAKGYFDWTVTLRAIGGGIQEHDRRDRFPYMAPDSGYLEEWQRTVAHYRGGYIEHRFYLKSRNGARYAEISLQIQPEWRGDNNRALVSVLYTTNLDGARELQRN